MIKDDNANEDRKNDKNNKDNKVVHDIVVNRPSKSGKETLKF